MGVELTEESQKEPLCMDACARGLRQDLCLVGYGGCLSFGESEGERRPGWCAPELGTVAEISPGEETEGLDRKCYIDEGHGLTCSAEETVTMLRPNKH